MISNGTKLNILEPTHSPELLKPSKPKLTILKLNSETKLTHIMIPSLNSPKILKEKEIIMFEI